MEPHVSVGSSDFYEIDIDGGGGSAYKENISSCNTTQLACRSSYDVLTGSKTGPTDQGVVALIGDPPRDTFVAVGRYQTPNGIRDMSKALVVAPVMDLATESVPPWGLGGFCPPPVGACMAPNPGKKCKQFPSGSNQKVSVKVVGFAMVLNETGEAVGSTTYMDIRPDHRGLEIGMTWIAGPYRGTFRPGSVARSASSNALRCVAAVAGRSSPRARACSSVLSM